MAHVVELWVKYPELKFQKTLALQLGWRWAPRVSDSPIASILFHQRSLLMGPCALLCSCHIPTPLVSFPFCGGLPPEVVLPPGSSGRQHARTRAQGRCLVLGLCPGAHAVASACVFVHKHASSACFFPQRETGSKQSEGWGREP